MRSRDIQRLEKAHYALQSCLYFTEAVDLTGAVAFFADGMIEPQWNHAALVRLEPQMEPHWEPQLETLLERIEREFAQRRLASAIEVCPACCPDALVGHLNARGYQRIYRYAWLVPDDTPTPPFAPNADAAVELRTVTSRTEIEAFLTVFRAAYEPPLDPGYARALLGSSPPSASPRSAETVHYLALKDGDPVAVASSIHGRCGTAHSTSGLYNLAVHPDHRRRGLGSLLTRHRLAEARQRGQQHIFLQTERRSVERWQRRHGFQLAFFTEGYAQPAQPLDPASRTLALRSEETP